MTYEEGDVLARDDGRLARVVDVADGFVRVVSDVWPPTWLSAELVEQFWRKVE